MNLSDYFFETDTGSFRFTRENGSQFAKNVAGDFNPLHDTDAKKFCIPGDLLFALSLAKLGVSKEMQFSFKGMIREDMTLHFDMIDEDNVQVVDSEDKEYLSIAREGDHSDSLDLANNLARSYVAFSGLTFPHILVPLMAEKNAMINSTRPLVIYQSMSIKLDTFDFVNATLEEVENCFNVEGKRGSTRLKFNFKDEQGKVVGQGEKIMTLSGLRDFDEDLMNALVVDYDLRKKAYKV